MYRSQLCAKIAVETVVNMIYSLVLLYYNYT